MTDLEFLLQKFLDPFACRPLMNLADILETAEASQHDDADGLRYAAKIPIVLFRRFDFVKKVDEIHSLHGCVILYYSALEKTA